MSWVRSVGFAAALLFSLLVLSNPADAQSALCPTGIPTQPGIAFQGSSCTNNVTGAYSNAALASQSLGELSESSTQDSTRVTMASVADRRATEAQACPAGFTRINGICQQSTSPSRFAPDGPDPVLAGMPSELMAFARVQPVLPLVPAAPRMAVWAQTYGDYEHQTGNSAGLGEFSVLALSAASTTWTGGVMGGADYTFRGIASGNDGLILGVLAGFESSHSSLATTSVSADPTSPNGYSTLKAQLSGPTTGVYGSYFNGPFSIDLAERIELFDLNLSFTDLLGYQSNPAVGFPPTSLPFSGSGTTSVVNYTTSGNVNYRIPVSATTWVEPTGGFQYTYSAYASTAEQYGLANGAVLRLQGGGRYGIEGTWNGMRLTTVLTGLLFDNAVVTGGVLANSPNPLILAGEGKLRGEGVLAFNLSQGNGVSYLAQAEVEGGNGLFGLGGKAGVRVAW